jgi:hypothetical protein
MLNLLYKSFKIVWYATLTFCVHYTIVNLFPN